MLVFPNAKINLGLFVTEKRPDGFHNIETILFPIPLYDALEITETIMSVETHGLASLYIHGIHIDGNPNENLVYKAYQLLKNDFDLPNIRIDLLKKIPFGAGLGGGSADAVFMLKVLNEKFSLNISDEKLESYARRIGSDCACFVKNKPVFAYEKGDVFEPIDLDLSDYQLVLICPPIHINTKMAYQNIVPRKTVMSSPSTTLGISSVETSSCYFDLQKLPKTPVELWKSVLQNDFEPSVFVQYPILSDIKQKLYDVGAEYASMSGSGSAMFGLFRRGVCNTPLQDIHNFLDITFKDCTVFCLNL
ncbi:MAG: 4-(cytidine 5'-diphospho)-2-C-methyl-D-erythritol kinase [Bacteroidales bacterium]|jgi:4-diphosphocytidyl-2-C-methyl-D-erythritol kinase|nr:4-(cytidine 5'-diphospho)-2-C-methyl-D-erythritol kinase [Bacteroidales bacterium]